MRTVLFIFSLVVLNFLSASAQSETRFYVESSLPEGQKPDGLKEVAVGTSFKVSFFLENGQNNGKFTPPDWEAAGFMVLGSSQSSNYSISNGKATASAAYHYTVTPIREGILTLPSVSIKNGDQELKTESITLQALPGADGISPSKPNSKPNKTPSKPPAEPKKPFKTIWM
jgi:uncharacterized protein (DUF58 family)